MADDTTGRAADRPSREDGAPESTKHTMMTRSATATVTGRASAMRRLRRRSHKAQTANLSADKLFCATNGCTSFLDLDTEAGVASCHICGYVRRLH